MTTAQSPPRPGTSTSDGLAGLGLGAPIAATDVDHRRRLYATLLRYPGLHLAALSREASVAEPLARYHMRVLVRRGLATELDEGGFTRYYPRVECTLGPREAVDRSDKAALALLRRPVPLRIVLALLGADTGRATMSDLAGQVGVSPPTATYHMGNLARAGLVTVERAGREKYVRLADPERVAALLNRYPPPRDVVAGFVDAWDQLEL